MRFSGDGSVLIRLFRILALAAAIFGTFNLLAHDDEDDEADLEHSRRGMLGAQNAKYKAECGSCHWPFPLGFCRSAHGIK